MAHRHGLTGRLPAAARLSALGAGVLAAHLGLLAWLAGQQADATALRGMNDPVFVRLLTPAAPRALASLAPAAPPAPQSAPGVMAAAVTARPARLPASAPPVAPAADPPQAATPEPAPAPDASDVPPATQVAAEELPAPPAAPSAAPPYEVVPAEVAAPPADTWPRDTRLTYLLNGQFRGGPLYGGARVQWQRQGTLYETRVEIDVVLAGSRILTSQGDVTPQGLAPRAYEEQRGNRRRSVRLTDTEVVLADGRSLPRPPDVQDTASQFVELGHRFATGRQALELGGNVELLLARPNGVERWIYDVVAQDLLNTPRLGEVMAWRLKPRPIAHNRGQLTAEMWFAPTLQYLPVRIRISLGDEAQVDLMVDTIEQR